MPILRRSVLSGLSGGAVATLLPALAASPAFGAPQPLDDFNVRTTVTQIFKPLVDNGKMKGVVVGVTFRRTDGTFARRYLDYGKLPLLGGGKGKAHPKDFVMLIASCTKVFTGTMLAYAAAYPNLPLGINQPVADLLPADTNINLYNNTPILLWHLASHCSGFPNGPCRTQNPSEKLGEYSFESLKAFLNDFHPEYAPGTKYNYSNQGFLLLGCLLSRVFSGEGITPRPATWDATYQKWAGWVGPALTTWLGMPNTVVDWMPNAGHVAQGYNFVSDGKFDEKNPPRWNLNSAGLPAGALCSTPGDMLTFLEAQIDPPSGYIGNAIKLTQTPVDKDAMPGIGLGWEIGNNYLAKDGGFDGYSSYMIVDKKAGIGVVVLCNTWLVSEATKKGGRELLHKLRGKALDDVEHIFPDKSKMPTCPA